MLQHFFCIYGNKIVRKCTVKNNNKQKKTKSDKSDSVQRRNNICDVN